MQKNWFRLFMRVTAVAGLLLSFGCTSFQLSSSPAADIYENGEKIARTPYSFKLVSGARTFKLKRTGYVEEELVVTSLDRKQVHLNLQWVGKTRVDSQPPGATVVRVEDGKVVGTTPCALYLSRPDRVLLKLNGFESVERDLTPNETYVIELESKAGFKSSFYKDIQFTSGQGPVEIYDRIAGERIGRTPVRLNVEAGAALEYRLPGHRSEFTLISRNAPYRIDIQLEPVRYITLTGPEGAGVYMAGGAEKLGVVPFEVQVEGYSLYDIKKEGFYDRSVGVAASSPDLLKVDMKAIPYKVITTDPPGGDIYRVGGVEKLGTAPLRLVVENERVFEVKKKGFRSSVVGVGPSSSEEVAVPLAPIGRDDPDAAAIGNLDSDVIGSF